MAVTIRRVSSQKTGQSENMLKENTKDRGIQLSIPGVNSLFRKLAIISNHYVYNQMLETIRIQSYIGGSDQRLDWTTHISHI